MSLKRIITTAAAVSVATAVAGKKAYAWKSSTHEHIAMKALELLSIDGYNEAYSFYSPYRETLAVFTQKPDYKGDVDKGKGWHYYCVTDVNGKKLPSSKNGYLKSGKNLLSTARYSRNARSIFEDNYQSALTFYRLGNIEKSIEFVARCVHMVADVGCTPHTTNLTLTSVQNSKHKRYEYYTSGVFEKYFADKGDGEVYNLFLSDDCFGDCFNELSRKSASDYDTVVNALGEDDLCETVERSLCVAQQYVAAFLLRFYNDSVSSDRGLLSGSRYIVRNAKSGEYICAAISDNERFVYCYTDDDREDASVLTLRISGDGSYTLVCDEAKLPLASRPFIKPKDKNAAPKDIIHFKIALTPNGYRITSCDSKYQKALSQSKLDDMIIFQYYNPDDLSQHWILEKV